MTVATGRPETVPDASSSDRLPALDGLRAVAALSILTTHCAFMTGAITWPRAGAVLARFDVGVAVFFALSGFLLVRPWLSRAVHHRAMPSSRTYALRRAARILPAYWLALTAVLVTVADADLAAAASNALLMQIYTDDLLTGFTQTWSLCTEIAFYAVLPGLAMLCVLVLRRAGAAAVVLIAAALAPLSWAWAAAAAAGDLPGGAGLWLPGHLDWFLVGIALAAVTVEATVVPESWARRLLDTAQATPGSLVVIGSALLLLASTPIAGPRSLDVTTPAAAATKEALYAVIALCLLFAAVAARPESGWLGGVLGSVPMVYLGRISYGIFLWHLLVLELSARVLGIEPFTGGLWALLPLTIAGSIVISTVSWQLLEQPILRRAHRAHAR